MPEEKNLIARLVIPPNLPPGATVGVDERGSRIIWKPSGKGASLDLADALRELGMVTVMGGDGTDALQRARSALGLWFPAAAEVCRRQSINGERAAALNERVERFIADASCILHGSPRPRQHDGERLAAVDNPRNSRAKIRLQKARETAAVLAAALPQPAICPRCAENWRPDCAGHWIGPQLDKAGIELSNELVKWWRAFEYVRVVDKESAAPWADSAAQPEIEPETTIGEAHKQLLDALLKTGAVSEDRRVSTNAILDLVDIQLRRLNDVRVELKAAKLIDVKDGNKDGGGTWLLPKGVSAARAARP